jgi:transposase-like protein
MLQSAIIIRKIDNGFWKIEKLEKIQNRFVLRMRKSFWGIIMKMKNKN